MWNCPVCDRIFQKVHQPHSCRKVSPGEHFKNKEGAKTLFEHLVKKIGAEIGPCKIISLPCCIHLYGAYDFLAALPKKDRLEIRFALPRKLESRRLRQSVPLSLRNVKNCIDIRDEKEINAELLGWIKESYYLKCGKN